jgi:ketosteroid isomerase-like protein
VTCNRGWEGRGGGKPRLLLVFLAAALGCQPSRNAELAHRGSSGLSEASQRAIADTLSGLIASAYDFSNRQGVVDRIMHLYADSGPVISASAGRIITDRDTLAAVIRRFWETTGINMQNPHWEWGDVYVDLLAPDAAAMTATYRISHFTPTGAPHVIAGAWTSVWIRQRDRWVIIQEHLSDLPAPAPVQPMQMH